MKTKQINKKLTLNKQTIARLDSHELQKAVGGSDTCTHDGWTCRWGGNSCEIVCFVTLGVQCATDKTCTEYPYCMTL